MDKFEIIKQCVESGDWTQYGDSITRNDLMDYVMRMTEPTLDNKGNLLKKIDGTECPLCGGKIKPMAFSITSRTVKFLMGLNFLCKKNLAEGGDGYIHYNDAIVFTSNHFKHTKGKKMGDGIVFTSYATLAKEYWELIEPRLSTNQKSARDGFFKITDRGRDFLNCLVAIPDKIYILDNKVVKISNKKIYASRVPDVNFQQCIEIYKTW